MGRIPEHEYIDAGGFKVVTYQLVELHHTPGEVESFCRWMGGQTCAVLDDGSRPWKPDSKSPRSI